MYVACGILHFNSAKERKIGANSFISFKIYYINFKITLTLDFAISILGPAAIIRAGCLV